jgi:hypothetical protein
VAIQNWEGRREPIAPLSFNNSWHLCQLRRRVEERRHCCKQPTMPRLLAFRKPAFSALHNLQRAQLEHNLQRAHNRPVHIPLVDLAANAVNQKPLEHAACSYQGPLSFSCSESPDFNLFSTRKKRNSQTSWKFWKEACNVENILQRGTVCAPHYCSSGEAFSSTSNLRPRTYSTRPGHPSFQEEKVDVMIIGAGVIGLAIARRLAQSGREVLVLESEDNYGTGTSSRNSEVIHAGLYYPPGSLKVRRRPVYASTLLAKKNLGL